MFLWAAQICALKGKQILIVKLLSLSPQDPNSGEWADNKIQLNRQFSPIYSQKSFRSCFDFGKPYRIETGSQVEDDIHILDQLFFFTPHFPWCGPRRVSERRVECY